MSDAIADKTVRLRQIYEVYEEWSGKYKFACRKSCSFCCTQSVTLTTLEAEMIVSFLRDQDQLEKLLSRASSSRFLPAMTTNKFARYCLAQEEPPEDISTPWNYEPCVFLQDNCCLIYPARPFGCRSFNSLSRCDRDGVAEAPQLMITVNTVFMQIIEDLDSDRGYWGNMLDLLGFLATGKTDPAAHGLLPAMPLPGFLIPPDEAEATGKIIEKMRRTALKGGRLDKLLQKNVFPLHNSPLP